MCGMVTKPGGQHNSTERVSRVPTNATRQGGGPCALRSSSSSTAVRFSASDGATYGIALAPRGDLARRGLDPGQRLVQVGLGVLDRDAVMPGEVEIHPTLHGRPEEAACQVAIPERRLA